MEVANAFGDVQLAYEAQPEMTPLTYALAGMDQVDARCDAFFSLIARADRRSAGYQGALNLLGGTITGAMAAGQESAESIATTALVFSGLDAQIANYRQFELLGPFAATASRLVRQAQAAYKTQPIPAGRVEAVNYVRGYARICAADTITAYINAAITNATPVLVSPESAAIAPADRQVVIAALTAVMPTIGQMTDAEWARLSVFLEDGPGAADLLRQFGEEMPSHQAKLVTTATPAQLTPEGVAVRDQLGALRVRSRVFAAATQTLRTERAALQAAGAATAGQDGAGRSGALPPAVLLASATAPIGVIVIQ